MYYFTIVFSCRVRFYVYVCTRLCWSWLEWYICMCGCEPSHIMCVFQALACAVVQLVLVSPGKKGQRLRWEVHGCGVVCLVVDRSVHSVFIRLYCLKKARLLWEQELYTPFKYSAPCPYFHIFPGDDCNVGLNFADEEEAEKFLSAVQTHIDSYTGRSQALQRTNSLDSPSGRLLWEQRERASLNSPTDFKPGPASPASLLTRGVFPLPPDFSTGKLSVKEEPTPSKSPTGPPQTLPRPRKVALPLAIRKGPLPPLPVHARLDGGREQAGSLILETTLGLPLCIPPPPPFQAPKRPGLTSAPPDGTKVRTLNSSDFPW
ncbi:hypothetical protein ACEWY4_012826 [Coilia grayii]|uniref:WH1 domain-containing protein n=1 Tax=Coilia grayii TaxID=363190 RepID=A0ABD1JUJ4_9TELE